MAAIKVITVLGESGQVHDAKVAAAGPHLVVRCRLAEIIETGPDKLTGDKGILAHAFKLDLWDIRPRSRGQ